MPKTKPANKGVDKVSAAFRRLGDLGNPKTLRTGDDIYVDPSTHRILRKKDTAKQTGKEDEFKSLTEKGKNRVIAVAATGTAAAYWKYGGEEYKTKAAAEKAKAKDQNTISDKEMAEIDEQIGRKKQKTSSAKKRKAEYAAHSKKQTQAAAAKKKADAAKKKKRRLIFGKDAKFRPFKGKIARALLGKDEKFGGDKGLIDFLNTGGSVTGLSKAQQNMLRQAQQHARSTGQNPKALQDLVSKYGNQLKGGGRKGKLKGRPRPGGRRNGGEAIAPPTPRIRPPAPAPAAASGLSKAQQNLLRQAQQHSQSTGQNPAKLQALTAQHGNLMKRGRGAAAGARPNLPRPGGMKAGGLAGKGRASKPRGVGAATRGYGRAMKK